MASFARVCILMLAIFTDRHFVNGEMFQFFLDIFDMMDPSWISSKHDSVGTRIECASLCYRDKGSCFYFGHKENTCYLLKDSVDRNTCSQDDCYDSGMKIYKWKHEVTSTETPSTETSTTTSTTTTAATTTTTTPATTTTTTPSTTTTTGTTTTTEGTTTTTKDTTTTEDTTTTTTETPTTTTTTTESPTTTTTETTTTTTEAPTTTTTTKAPTTTTTTEAPTTTTTETPTTTTTEATSTTTEGWNCKLPEGAEADVDCKQNTLLLNALGTRYPFLTDAVVPKCTNMNEQVFVEEETTHTFFTLDGGLTLNSKCPDPHHVIHKFKLCVKNQRPAAITLHCRFLKDPGKIEEHYNVTTNDVNTLVNCSDYSAIQSITFRPHEDNDVLTKIDFSCVKVEVKELGLPVGTEVAPDTEDAASVG